MLKRPRADGSNRPGEPSQRTCAWNARVAEWLQPQAILLDVAASDREQVLLTAARTIGARSGLSRDLVRDALWRREQAGTTALAAGFAIPHARIAGIARPATWYLRTRAPLAAGAADGLPTSHFLAILVPSDGDADDHLQLLAFVARLFSDPGFRKNIDAARDADTATAAFAQGIGRLLAG